MGYEYDEAVLKCFLKQQDRLFRSRVAEGMEEAEAFLEDCMAVVVDSKAAVMEYFEEAGIDVENPDQVLDEAEVFDVGDGRYLIVEGDKRTKKPRNFVAVVTFPELFIHDTFYISNSCKIASESPSWSLSCCVIKSAQALTSGVAFAIATAVPAACSMEISFSASPAATLLESGI